MGSVRLPLDFQLLQSISKKQEGGPRRPTTHWEGEDFIGKNPWKNTVATQKSPGFLKKSGFSPKMNWIFQDFPPKSPGWPFKSPGFSHVFSIFFCVMEHDNEKEPGYPPFGELGVGKCPKFVHFFWDPAGSYKDPRSALSLCPNCRHGDVAHMAGTFAPLSSNPVWNFMRMLENGWIMIMISLYMIPKIKRNDEMIHAQPAFITDNFTLCIMG